MGEIAELLTCDLALAYYSSAARQCLACRQAIAHVRTRIRISPPRAEVRHRVAGLDAVHAITLVRTFVHVDYIHQTSDTMLPIAQLNEANVSGNTSDMAFIFAMLSMLALVFSLGLSAGVSLEKHRHSATSSAVQGAVAPSFVTAPSTTTAPASAESAKR